MKCPQVGLGLGVLICPIWAVLDRSAQAADQEFFVADQFQVQIRAALGVRLGILEVVFWVMITWHVKKGNIQKGNEVLKIIIGQVAASKYQFKILKMPARAKAVKALYYFVTDCQDFHNVLFSRRKVFRARCGKMQAKYMKTKKHVYETEMLGSCGQLSNKGLQTIIQ